MTSKQFRPLSVAGAALVTLFALSAQASAAYRMQVPIPALSKGGSTPTNPGTPTGPVMPPDPLALSLQTSTLQDAIQGKPYSFNFASLLYAQGDGSADLAVGSVTWSKASGTIPAGLTLTGSVLAGTPTTVDPGSSFEILATYEDANAQQVYTIKVGENILHVKSISAGTNHTCGITPEGGVKCWGQSSAGRLGNNSTTVPMYPVVDVVGLTSGVTAVSAGFAHTCAVASGGVWCWGNNATGQLGTGNTSNSLFPVPVTGLQGGATAVAAGGTHTCAIVLGAVKCWGAGWTGQLGDGNTSQSSVPVDAVGLSAGATAIMARGAVTCAVVAGAAKCWGSGTGSGLGDGTAQYSAVPVTPLGLSTGVTSIGVGNSHICVVANGAVYCWGSNSQGQLGDGTTSSVVVNLPVSVVGLPAGASAVTAGALHSCAIVSGAAYCWGGSSSGQVGAGSTSQALTPVSVVGLGSGVTDITAGNSHTCAVASGGAKCWGSGGPGSARQLGSPVASAFEPINVPAYFAP